MIPTLDNKVVLVTGAAQGIGREYAHALARAGASVVVTDVQRDKVEAVADEIRGAGGTAIGVSHDITSEESNADVVAATVAEYGRIDGLVNNAAIYAGLERTPWTDLTLDDWDRLMRVNVRGLWQTSKAVVPVMRSSGGGRIVHQSSITAWGSNILHYGVSKAAVVGLTRSMAKLVGPDLITVNAIAPGVIGTDASIDLLDGGAGIDARVQKQTIKRLGQAEDLCGVVTFLCSDAASWITGQVIVVDGGVIMA